MASRILLADDSITIQKVVNLTFADEGIEVVAVSSGDMAERRLPEVSPDLVLADIFMPGKNGYELCEAIKENSQFQHVPVVLLVGAFEPFDQAEANRVKADAHLTKPFESRTLVETVRRLISNSGLGMNGAPPQMSSVRDEAEEAIDALAPVAAPPPFVAPENIDFSAMMPENNLDASTPPTRTTGELGSPTPDLSRGAFDVQSTHAPEAHAMNEDQAATDISHSMTEPIEVFEFSGNGDFTVGDSANSFRLNDHEMVNDFERSDVLEPIEYAHDPVTLKAESNSLLDVNISGAGEGESWFSPDTFGNLQADHHASDNGWQDNSVAAQGSTEVAMHTAGGSEVVQESSDTTCATLLAVDEPLGDVLFDEPVSVDRLAHLQSSPSDSLGFEFIETEVADMVAPASTHFDLVEAAQEPAPETSFNFIESPTEEMAAAEVPSAAAEEPAAVHESVAAVQEPVPAVQEPVAAFEETVAMASEPAAVQEQHAREQHAVEEPNLTGTELKEQPPVQEAHSWQDAVADLDWTTPHAATQSTAELDSAVMPVHTEEPQPEASVVPDPVITKTSDDSGFIAAHTWTDEETRFTPIDIEAVALEDPSEIAAHSEIAPETGFVVASVLAQEPPAMMESSVADGAEEAQSAVAAADLSAAAIDQIVRRVLSQLSESVVREVAWEVVPDCVERVIEQLTRESLSKRA
jgi:CheY-like chemotaxis protein